MIQPFFLLSQEKKFDIGIQIGPGLKKIIREKIPGIDNPLGINYSGGVFWGYSFSEKYSLVVNSLFINKGSLYKSHSVDPIGGITGKININRNLSYIEVPLMFRYKSGGAESFFINLGVFGSYLLKDMEVTTGDNIQKYTYDYSEYDNKVDYGVSGGFGIIEKCSSKLKYFIEIRADLGLHEMNKDTSHNNSDSKTFSTNLFFGLMF